ncbi:unnamed protein product [Clavelina lepadiformis]|uniref:Uncharacterized protein n=1 Tax=Clavelina lepadiformis TaxID=159417 RepID=A0ABP0FHB5_CLALP
MEREAELKKHKGAMLKFVTSSGSNVFLTLPENDSNENPDNNAELQRDTENISLSAETQGSIKSNTNEINYALPVIDEDDRRRSK